MFRLVVTGRHFCVQNSNHFAARPQHRKRKSEQSATEGGGSGGGQSLIRSEEINFIHFRFIAVHTYWQMSKVAIKPSYSSNFPSNWKFYSNTTYLYVVLWAFYNNSNPLSAGLLCTSRQQTDDAMCVCVLQAIRRGRKLAKTFRFDTLWASRNYSRILSSLDMASCKAILWLETVAARMRNDGG